MKYRSGFFIGGLGLFMLFLWACQPRVTLSDEMSFLLEMSGPNREELMKVIRHCHRKDDSLKLEAAYFLIRNMPFNYSYYGPLKDHFDTIFREMTIRSGAEDNALWKSLSDKYGDLTLNKLSDSIDLQVIEAEYLTKGDNYAKMGNFEQAEAAYRHACYMIPVLFYPKYFLADLS